MWRIDPRRAQAVAALATTVALTLALAGAGTPPSKKKRAAPPKVEETVGDLADIFHRAETHLEGVGLVVGLDNTGADAPPSQYRQRLLDDMRKAGVENPNQWLRDPRCSMVIVRLTVPIGVTTTDRLDVEVAAPPGGGTKSLAGGYLLATRLREVMVLNNGESHEKLDGAFAQGPVMTGSVKSPDDRRFGRVLGGGRVKKEIPFQVALKDTRKSFKASKMVETAINQRFPQTHGIQQTGSAVAKTDQLIQLTVPRVYHENQVRYFSVVKLVPIVDTPELRAQRTAEWGRDLLKPEKAKQAALKLEALGPTAVEALKEGLASPDPKVRFYSAESLAYLNDPSAADGLGDAAIHTPEFRPYALAALSAMDHPASHLKLRKLMDEADVDLRYGAFNALRVAFADDPFLGRVRVLDDPTDGDDEELNSDSMSLALDAGTRRKPRLDDPFALYLVDCDGPPMVHVARTRRCEMVVFGRGMKLLPPVVLDAGPLLLNASDGDETIQISKIVTSKSGTGETKVESSLSLGDVMRRAANLGASYPELVTILQGASRQHNLPGPLVIDALPGSSPKPVVADGKKAKSKKDGDVKRAKMDDSAKPRGFLNRLFNRDPK